MAMKNSAVLVAPRGLGAQLQGRLFGQGVVAAPRTRGLERERHAPEYSLLLAIVALTAIGILMVYSSSGVRSYLKDEDPFAVVGPQLLWAALGVIAMAVTMRIDYRWLRLVSVPLYLAATALLFLVLLPPMGPITPREVGGSARWLQIGSLPAIHPAEFAKLALVVYLAHWMARRGGRIEGFFEGTLPFLLLAGPVIVLVVREPDLGTTGVLMLTAFTMFVVAGANLRQFLVLIPAIVGGLAAVISQNAYQLLRVEAYLDPWKDPQGIGFHTIQGLLALGLGGLIGGGLGQSRQAGSLYLPNASNDFVFAVIAEEFGLIGGLIVIALFLALAYYGIKVALAAPDTFGGLLATGITAWLALQAFVNIGVVVSLIPITGITLPFVSAGGSSLIVSFVAVGILLSISRETQPRGTWNDADPDRRRRHGRTHLPGVGGRPRAARKPAGR
jgi:cell division protein FtsW